MIRIGKVYNASEALKLKAKKRRMKKNKFGIIDFIFVLVFTIVIYSLFANIKLSQTLAKADEFIAAQGITETKYVPVTVEIEKEDLRVKKLAEFLKSKNSPLEPYANFIVTEADRYDIGWTKLAAISGMESDYCKRTIPGSYNCWGLGGNQFMRFSSYEVAIEYASRLIGTEYKWNENQGIKSKYCPETSGCNPNWANSVTSFTNEILSLKGEKND